MREKIKRFFIVKPDSEYIDTLPRKVLYMSLLTIPSLIIIYGVYSAPDDGGMAAIMLIPFFFPALLTPFVIVYALYFAVLSKDRIKSYTIIAFVLAHALLILKISEVY